MQDQTCRLLGELSCSTLPIWWQCFNVALLLVLEMNETHDINFCLLSKLKCLSNKKESLLLVLMSLYGMTSNLGLPWLMIALLNILASSSLACTYFAWEVCTNAGRMPNFELIIRILNLQWILNKSIKPMQYIDNTC